MGILDWAVRLFLCRCTAHAEKYSGNVQWNHSKLDLKPPCSLLAVRTSSSWSAYRKGPLGMPRMPDQATHHCAISIVRPLGAPAHA